MDIVQVVILALIQGITEFLPISSSAHLILPSQVLGWPDQGLAFDVAVHVGTLAAVVVYFRRDISQILMAWCKQVTGGDSTAESRLAWYIALGTVPVGLAGILFKDLIEVHLRNSFVIAIASILFGLLLWWVDVRAKQNVKLIEMTFMMALLIGLAQALALFPGTSRSGITITMALFLGFSRTDAARFSFLLSIPVIILSGAVAGSELISVGTVDWRSVILGAGVSAVSAYLCIHYFLSFISRLSMLPFVVYRIILGFILLGLTFSA